MRNNPSDNQSNVATKMPLPSAHEMSITRRLFHSDKRSSGHFAHASVRKRPVRYCLKSFRLRNNPGALHIYIPPSFSPDTKMSDTHVYTLFFNPLIRRKKLANWPNSLANRTLAKRLVRELIFNRNFSFGWCCTRLRLVFLSRNGATKPQDKLQEQLACP